MIKSKRKQAYPSICRPASMAGAEFLEPRYLFDAAPFSISSATLLGPSITPGTKYSYEQIADNGTTAVHKETVGAPTKQNGNNVIPIDDELTTTSGDVPPKIFTGSITSYSAIVNGALVTYDADIVNNTANDTATVTNTPFETALPPLLTLGQSYTFTFTQTTDNTPSGMAPTTSSVTITDVLTLASDQTQSITVPKGTYNCYEVDTSETVAATGNVLPNAPDLSKVFWAPGVGAVERHNVGDSTANDLKLVDFSSNADTLSFSSGGSATAAGENIKPPVVVKILDQNGDVQSTGDNSTARITLTLSGGGTLVGTATVAAVGGVATFSDLSIPSPGTYTLTATGDSLVSKTSDPFTISAGEPATLTPTLPRLNYPVSAVGGSKVSINANITVTNNSDSTVTGTAKVTAMLVGPTNAAPAVIHLGDSFVAAPATVSLQVGKTVSQHVNIKSHKTGKLNIHITSLPNVAVAGSYTLEFVVTDPKGNSATVVGPSINIGPAMIALSETISSLKIPATITIGQKLKAASIKLIIKNSGNVIAKGKTSFSVSASTVSGSVGTPITSYSTVLNTAPNKTKPVSINIKSLPTLAAGSYFIVIHAVDSMGNPSVVSTASPITVTA